MRTSSLLVLCLLGTPTTSLGDALVCVPYTDLERYGPTPVCPDVSPRLNPYGPGLPVPFTPSTPAPVFDVGSAPVIEGPTQPHGLDDEVRHAVYSETHAPMAMTREAHDVAEPGLLGLLLVGVGLWCRRRC